MLFCVLIPGVQQGSQHGESKQSQARKAIIRMLGKWKNCKNILVRTPNDELHSCIQES